MGPSHNPEPLRMTRPGHENAESLQSLSDAEMENLGFAGLFAAPVMQRLADRLPPRDRSGFTMVELVVMMLIIGILAVVVLPRFDLLQGFDEIGYRDKVKATLEYARKSAVAQRRNVQVAIAGSGLAVTRQTATPEGEGIAAWVALNLPGTSTNAFAAPAGVTLSPGLATIIFDPLGRPVTLTASSFTVSGGAGTITIEAETRYVH